MTNQFDTSKYSQQDPLIVRLLENINRLDPERLAELYVAPNRHEVSFEELIISSGLADERQIAAAYADHYLMPLFDPPPDSPHQSIAQSPRCYLVGSVGTT